MSSGEIHPSQTRGPARRAAPLRSAPNILLTPGTSRLAHLRENLAAVALELSEETNHVLVMQAREIAGREASPTAGVIDS